MSPEITPGVVDRAMLAELRARDLEALGLERAASLWRKAEAGRLTNEGFDVIGAASIRDAARHSLTDLDNTSTAERFLPE